MKDVLLLPGVHGDEAAFEFGTRKDLKDDELWLVVESELLRIDLDIGLRCVLGSRTGGTALHQVS